MCFNVVIYQNFSYCNKSIFGGGGGGWGGGNDQNVSFVVRNKLWGGGEVIRHQLNYLLIISFSPIFLHYDSAKSFISIGFASKFLCAFIHYYGGANRSILFSSITVINQ